MSYLDTPDMEAVRIVEANRTAQPPEERIAELEDALWACIPWVATNKRGHAQEALAIACALVGANPYDYTGSPETLTRRRTLLGLEDRRKP